MRNTLRYRSVTMEAPSDEGVLSGYATIFNSPYPIAPGLTETIQRGAFDESLRARDGIVPVFWNHGWAKTNEVPIGWALLREDATGVRIEEAHLFTDTDKGKAVDASTRARSLKEWSLGFKASKIRKRAADESIEIGDIVELSVVIRGAAVTQMGFRDAKDVVLLREAGMIDPGVELVDETQEEEPPEGSSESENEGGNVIEDGALTALREQALGRLSSPGVRAALRETFNKEQ